MSVSPLDSAILGPLFGEPTLSALFHDAATIAAMLRVEGALAEVQGAAGVIPQDAARAIAQAATQARIDPATLGPATARDGVPVPALLAAFRGTLPPEAAAFVHWGATSQDIIDTGLALRLRDALELIETSLARLLRALAGTALAHAETAMAARTYGQHAAPSSFGAVAAAWGRPLLRQRARLGAHRAEVCVVSLSGAVGTAAHLGGPGIRAALAKRLGLGDPGADWHTARDGIAGLGQWLAANAGLTAKIGRDMDRMCQSGRTILRLSQGGASSTMPQKSNPIGPAVLVALAAFSTEQASVLNGALAPSEARDGGTWFAEWLSLPGLVVAAGRALTLAADLVETAEPLTDAMAQELDGGLGLIDAEAITFALARQMPRPEAQARVKHFVAEALASGRRLTDLVAEAGFQPQIDPKTRLGDAPHAARAFAADVTAALGG
ncbi:MAG: lyase family protein [Pseudomonadota bacterium]